MNLENNGGINCINCGKKIKSFHNHSRVYICPGCGLGKQIDFPTNEELDEIYSDEYFKSWGNDGNIEDYWGLKTSLVEKILAESGQCIKGKKVLDVGCATGASLSVIHEKGGLPYGIDVNKHAIEKARALVPTAQVSNCNFMDVDFSGKLFDIIILSDVLEHFFDPLTGLEKAESLLNANGKLLILTPDISSFSARIMGAKWSHIKTEHLFYLSCLSMRSLLSKCRLRTESISSFFKPMNLEYMANQYRIYKHPVLTPFFNTIRYFLPQVILSHRFHIPMGEMFVVASPEDRRE